MEKITFNDFKKIELKAATIIAAEPVQDSEKLIKLEIDLGEPAHRQILAGIKQCYAPDQLIGRQIIVAANLEARQMMGLESNGMLLAASSENGPVLLCLDKPVAPGSEIR